MEDILKKLEDMIKRISFSDEFVIREDINLSDLPCWDDLDTVDLCMAIEEEFDIDITEEEYDMFDDNIGEIAKYIQNKK